MTRQHGSSSSGLDLHREAREHSAGYAPSSSSSSAFFHASSPHGGGSHVENGGPGFIGVPASSSASSTSSSSSAALYGDHQHAAMNHFGHLPHHQHHLSLSQQSARAHAHLHNHAQLHGTAHALAEGQSSYAWDHMHAIHHHARRLVGMPDYKYSLFETEDVTAWLAFTGFFFLLIFCDLFLMNRKKQRMTLFAATCQTLFWMFMASLFCAFLYQRYGRKDAYQWASGYILEWMLSFDNLFVFHLIFRVYQTPETLKHKPLIVGICGAVVLRLGFIVIGELLMHAIWAAHLVFGMFLVYTGVRAIVQEEDDEDPTQFSSVRFLQKRVPFVGIYDQEGSFFIQVPMDANGNLMSVEHLKYDPTRDSNLKGESSMAALAGSSKNDDLQLHNAAITTTAGAKINSSRSSCDADANSCAANGARQILMSPPTSVDELKLLRNMSKPNSSPRQVAKGAGPSTTASNANSCEIVVNKEQDRDHGQLSTTTAATNSNASLAAHDLYYESGHFSSLPADPPKNVHHYETRATMLFLVVVCLEICDLIFAVDSVSAIVAQVSDLFLTYTSAVFAMLGIRCLFFIVNALADVFALLQYGVSLILILLGLKLVLSKVIEISPEIVCLSLFLILVASMVASVVMDMCEQERSKSKDSSSVGFGSPGGDIASHREDVSPQHEVEQQRESRSTPARGPGVEAGPAHEAKVVARAAPAV